MGGAADAYGTHALIPVWAGTLETPLSVVTRQCGLYYDLYNPASSMRSDANILKDAVEYNRISTRITKDAQHLFLDVGKMDEQDLSAAIYGMVLSVQPTDEKPMIFTLRPAAENFDNLKSFVKSEKWEETLYGNKPALVCKFALDPKTGQLTQGVLPLIKIKKSKTGSLWTQNLPSE